MWHYNCLKCHCCSSLKHYLCCHKGYLWWSFVWESICCIMTLKYQELHQNKHRDRCSSRFYRRNYQYLREIFFSPFVVNSTQQRNILNFFFYIMEKMLQYQMKWKIFVNCPTTTCMFYFLQIQKFWILNWNHDTENFKNHF